MAVRYQNIPSAQERPPEYNQISVMSPPQEPLIMIPIRKEIKQVERRQSRNQLIKRYVCGFSIGFIFCAAAFLACHFLWKQYGKSTFETENKADVCQKRVVGYYKGWGNHKITEKQIEKLTHIIFDDIKLKADGKIEFESDETRILLLDMKNKARIMKSNVKIMFSTDAHYKNVKELAPVMADSKLRKNWINSIASFILEQQLYGVELYYRWPETKEQKEDYVFLVRELRYKLEKVEKLAHRTVPYIISIYCPPFEWHDESETILHDLLDHADFLSVETDNYYVAGHLVATSGPMAPLFSNHNKRNVDWTLKAYTCKTMQPSRLNMIVTFRASHWKNVNLTETDGVYGSVEQGETQENPTSWRNLKKMGLNLTNASWHNETKTAYIWNSEKRSFLSFENEKSIIEKVKYAAQKNLGGISINKVELDDDELTLLNAVTSVDLCSDEMLKKDEIKYDCGNSGPKQK